MQTALLERWTKADGQAWLAWSRVHWRGLAAAALGLILLVRLTLRSEPAPSAAVAQGEQIRKETFTNPPAVDKSRLQDAELLALLDGGESGINLDPGRPAPPLELHRGRALFPRVIEYSGRKWIETESQAWAAEYRQAVPELELFAGYEAENGLDRLVWQVTAPNANARGLREMISIILPDDSLIARAERQDGLVLMHLSRIVDGHRQHQMFRARDGKLLADLELAK